MTSPIRRLVRANLRANWAGRAHLVFWRNVIGQRHSWMISVSGFFEPVFYLLALGFGVGALVGDVEVDGRLIPYLEFVAPGVLAASAMTGAIVESTYNVYYKLRLGQYQSLLATPLGAVDIALGEVAWAVARGTVYAAGFLGIGALFGLVSSPWALLVAPVACLSSFTFAALGMAATTYMRSWEDFDFVPLVQLPMFFLATTWFPLSVYPDPLRPVVELMPLYHSVEITRSTMLGTPGADFLWHVLYLAVLATVGLVVAARRVRKLLLR